MGRTKLFITKKIGPMDFPLMITTLLLVLIGIVAVFSASFYSSISESGSPYGFAIKQVVFAIMGLICMVLATKMNYHVWRTFAIPILGVSFFLLVIVIAGAGTTVNGATRWIRIFGFSLMPGEISKFSMIIATAAYISAKPKRVNTLKGLFPIIICLGLACALIMKQPSLSVAATLAVIIMCMLIVAGLNKTFLIGGGALFAVSLIFAII